MAVLAGSVHSVGPIYAPAGAKATSAGAEVITVLVKASFSGTYAQADDANLAIGTAIDSALRNGKTHSVLDACFAAPGTDASGVAVFTKAVTNSSNTLSFQLYGADTSTEQSNGSLVTSDPVAFWVTCTAV